MAQSPIQIVLNSSDFIQMWDRSGGGGHKDFYEGNDKEFVKHRNKLAQQLSSLKPDARNKEQSGISYAKVTLKQSALAKSHRPTTSIFNRDVAPVIGGGDLGELLVELSPGVIDRLSEKVLRAEAETRWKEDKSGKRISNPSSLRSEVGAIEEIKPYAVSDKRKFSLGEAIKWLSDPRTGGAYIVELFEIPPPKKDWDNLTPEKLKLFKSFVDGLSRLGNGVIVSRIVSNEKSVPMISIRLEGNIKQSNIQFAPVRSSAKRIDNPDKTDFNRSRHAALIAFLDEHQLVRKVKLPPIISKSVTKPIPQIGEAHTLPTLEKKKSYPKVAVVDGGVSGVLNEWVEERHGLLSPGDKDENHGTFIAGLLLSGAGLNGTDICKEVDGCKIIDLDLLPVDAYFSNYYKSSLEFFDELENAVRDLKAKTGVRIFNFSLNIMEHASTDNYSWPAQRLDDIAQDNDVIFIISAGNALPNDYRKEWPEDPASALAILASSRNDTIKTPAESYRNISVSALNPPNLKGLVPFALSNYSCRGPGTRTGLKPDLAHVGGSGNKGHGLRSIDDQGFISEGCGTSYAAPNVAKSIACLDHAIEGDVSRESLIALAIHHARVPDVMTHKIIKDVAKDLVGFGIPGSSEEILNGSDSSITLVFANRIYPTRRMSFAFSWPAALVNDNKCLGHARLTIASTPPFNHKFGTEFVRVNIEGHLRQLQDDGTFKGRLSSIYLPENSTGLYEKSMIEHSFKWSPVKVFEGNFVKGVGPGADWRLDVEYLARDGEDIPQEGVPFTAILTISDPKGKAPVFNSMRQSLQATGVNILDIKTAARVIPRV